MAIEGMVHALRRVRELVRSTGQVIDLHPTAEPAWLEIGAERVGAVETGDAPARHAAADVALKTAVDAGLFAAEGSAVFQFFTYGDSIEGLSDHVRQTWRSARIESPVVEKARAAMRSAAGKRPRVCEHVRLTRLRPMAGVV